MAVANRRANGFSSRGSDLIIVLGVVGIVLMLIIPVPPILLDILLALNISLGMLVLLLTMNIRRSLEFAAFPSLLLVLTLFRLSLNISSTRLILLRGYAGDIIQAFGNFVVGGNYVVGFVVFFILVIIQFVVITKGAERVAEVAARFTLDAMPGKQMAIDADLNSGLITESEAKTRRKEISQEADFYGAMDGASKFVKGDAIAGIIITLINAVGGLVIGMVQRGMDFQGALVRYTLLTVGDGLVSQIPALLIATATGIIVTRAAGEQSMGQDLASQLFSTPKPLFTAAGILATLGLVPGLPFLPFILLGGMAGFLGLRVSSRMVESSRTQEAAAQEEAVEDQRSPESVLSTVQVDPVELEFGYSLLPFVDEDQGGDLLDRITVIRRQIAMELGVVAPIIRIRDNLQLEPSAYAVKIKGVGVAKGELINDHLLAMDAGGVTEKVTGIPTIEPAFGLEALWIPSSRREEVEMAGYTVVDPPTVLATHLSEILKSNLAEFLGRQEVKALTEVVKERAPAVVEELVGDLLSLGEIQKVLQNLVKEGVSIRDLVTIFEALADYAPQAKDTDFLTEQVRKGLARQLTHAHVDGDGAVRVLALSSDVEDLVREALQTGGGIPPAKWQKLSASLRTQMDRAHSQGYQPIVLTAPEVRLAFRRLTEGLAPSLVVLSYQELLPQVEVRTIGMVSL